MGCFTTVVLPGTGETVQFKLGDDTCETVQFGERIGCAPGESCIEHGIGRRGEEEFARWWVVVKDGSVRAVVPMTLGQDLAGCDDPDIADFERLALAWMYGIGVDSYVIRWLGRCVRATEWVPPRARVRSFLRYFPLWGWWVRRRERRRFWLAASLAISRSMWPRLVASNIVSVEPMGDEPTAEVHYFDYFDTKEGDDA